MGDQLRQVAVATDDRVGLSGHAQREEFVVVRIT